MGSKGKSPPPLAPPVVEDKDDEAPDTDDSGVDTESAQQIANASEAALSTVLDDDEDSNPLTIL